MELPALVGFTYHELLDLRRVLAERDITLPEMIADLRGQRRLVPLPRWSEEEIAQGNALARKLRGEEKDMSQDVIRPKFGRIGVDLTPSIVEGKSSSFTRSDAVRCLTCMFYDDGRCRVNPPRLTRKWPEVAATDWCGAWRRA